MLKNPQFQNILANLNALSFRQKISLAVLGVVLTIGTLGVTYLLNSPTTATVYTDIPREELSRMSRILAEDGLDFDIDLDRGSISVAPQHIEEARLLLADHGLPSGSDAGYELFDKVNSLGLTSFMQEVTKTRATEGELARTIQMISGIKSARVHLVLPEERGFRARTSEGPTASVVINGNGVVTASIANAIRHLVAGGVRGLDADNVTVLRADGTLIASSDDKVGAGSLRLAELESSYERELADKINAALGQHLGEPNYRVSVTAKLNSDQRRTDETTFFPESRVERSVRVVRENGTSENSESAAPTTVSENIPVDATTTGTTGQSTRENNEKRDEVTNYEISQKKVSTISEGYKVERLAVALVVNRERIAALLPADSDQAAFDAKLEELRQTVEAAIGFSRDRGDLVEVNALEFLPQELSADETSSGMFRQFLSRNFASMLNAVAAIVAVLVLAFLVVRPILAFLAREPRQTARGPDDGGSGHEPAGASAGSGSIEAGAGEALAMTGGSGNLQLAGGSSHASASGEPYMFDRHDQAVHQLAGLVDQSEERAAHVIRDWLATGAGART